MSCKELEGLSYKHPWDKNKVLKVFESSSVTLSGTGLLHSVPAHGHEDFVMGLQNNLTPVIIMMKFKYNFRKVISK